MQPYLTGEVTLLFINAGLAKKSQKPYLMASNGLVQIFVDLPKNFDVSAFDEYNEGDEITFNAKTRVGSDRVTFIS